MNKAKLAAIDAVYALVPRIACRRLCTAACGPIGMSQLEAKRVEKKTHRLPQENGDEGGRGANGMICGRKVRSDSPPRELP